MSEAGSAPERSTSAEVGGFLLGEGAGDPALVVDPRWMLGAESDPAVEHDGQLAVDVGLGEGAELRARPRLFSEKLTAGRLFSSSDGRALRRSRPVTAATRRTA